VDNDDYYVKIKLSILEFAPDIVKAAY